MTSTNKSPDTSIRHILPNGSSIHIDPPLDPPLKPGQYDRLLNSALLDPRVYGASAAGPHTVEGAFNRLVAEAETTGLATNFLYHVQKDTDSRLRAFAEGVERDYREVRSTIDGLARIVENCRREAATYECALLLRVCRLRVADWCVVGPG